MKAVSGRRLCGILESNGWQLKRVSGSHHIYTNAGVAVRISVPVHANRELKVGLQRHLMRLADITESDL